MRFVIIVFLSLMSCGQSPEDKAIEEIAKALNIDKEDVKGISYYSFTVEGGALDGKTFVTPNYAQTSNGMRYDGNSQLETISITFVDPVQNNSSFEVRVKDNKAKSFGASTGSVFNLSVKSNDKKYQLISESGTLKTITFIDEEEPENEMNYSKERRHFEFLFEGVFVENSSGEKVKVKGELQIVKN